MDDRTKSNAVAPREVGLGVNVDHVATIRQARRAAYPDPVEAAELAERGGASGITVHLREDRRHIQDHDVERLLRRVRTKVNLEMTATDAMVEAAIRLRPHDVCLVPERRQELTTEGGLDVAGARERLRSVVARLRAAEIRVSLFVDPDDAQLEASVAVGAEIVELHTGAYADAHGSRELGELARLRRAAVAAHAGGLQVNAGHGLRLDNTARIAAIPEIVELNIGHAIVARAVLVGMERAVAEMRAVIDGALS